MNLRTKKINKEKNLQNTSKKVPKKSSDLNNKIEVAPKIQTRRSKLNNVHKNDVKVENTSSPHKKDDVKRVIGKYMPKTRTGRQSKTSDEKIEETDLTKNDKIEKINAKDKSVMKGNVIRRSRRILNDSVIENNDQVKKKPVEITPKRLSLRVKSKNEQNTINPSQIKNTITKEVNKKQPVSFKTKQSPRKLVKSPKKPIQHTKIKEKSLKEPKKEEKVTKLVKTTEKKSLNKPKTKENTVIPSVGNKSMEKGNKTQRKSLKTCESPVKPLNLPVKQFSVVVTERNSLNNVETRQLRNKKPQNYIEDSINCTNSSKTSQTPVKGNKVPVYKKLPKNDEPKKAKKDPYEFDVPIEKRNLNDSSKYDKKMHEIMQNIIRKVEKQKKTVKRRKTDVKLKRREKNIQLTKDVDKESEQILPDPIQTPKEPNKIVVLNDCKLDKPMDTPKNFKNPNANSTFVENVSSPWRFPSEMIIYNPHFIKLKDTALPSINQEPIIDYKLEAARKSHKTPPERQNVRKSPVQKSILNYLKVSGNFEPTINRNLSCSLFDADQLSPIKARPSVEMKQTVKRNILNESNKQNVENRTSLFGFEQSDVDNGENKENSSSSPIRRPFRYEMKQYKRKTVEKPVPVEPEIEKNVPDDVVEEESVENESIELFEDPENMFKQTEVNVERKRRRPRYLSTNSDVEEAPRKRKKDVFTKEEEEAFNKWVDQFNSMCEEVDKHVLEIE